MQQNRYTRLRSQPRRINLTQLHCPMVEKWESWVQIHSREVFNVFNASATMLRRVQHLMDNEDSQSQADQVTIVGV
jgi:hypothetical protein